MTAPGVAILASVGRSGVGVISEPGTESSDLPGSRSLPLRPHGGLGPRRSYPLVLVPLICTFLLKLVLQPARRHRKDTGGARSRRQFHKMTACHKRSGSIPDIRRLPDDLF
mgnify:CR=1 FL=1